MKCPQCSAEAAKVGAFWICPQHGQLPEPKPTAHLRIFLSNGHDANVEQVRRIKADLEKRGHDVWFDKSAFAAHLTHFGRDKVIAAQFVEWDKPDHRSAQRVVRSLALG